MRTVHAMLNSGMVTIVFIANTSSSTALASNNVPQTEQTKAKSTITLAPGKSTGLQEFQVLDVQKLSADQPDGAVKSFVLNRRPRVVHCDVFIAGGGMGGIAASLRAAQNGAHVCLTEETDWLGGQMTAQGVSALDENYMVEDSGSTRLYQQLRSAIRQHYRNLPGASKETAGDERLNPGDCWVSWLSFEPSVALEQLTQLIAQQAHRQRLSINKREKVVKLKVQHGTVRSALCVNLDTGDFTEYRARVFLDATELGDLLPLAGVHYSYGAESRKETGEPHAPPEANHENVQDFTYPFVVDFRPGQNNLIPKPTEYDNFNAGGKFSFIGYKMFSCNQSADGSREYLPFWTYRRLIARDKFPDDSLFAHDLAMINWESNDLRGQNIIDKPPAVQAQRLAQGKQLSLGFLYWLQREAPRDDGGKGYPELHLRPDVVDTTDGISKYPYIRESRRIKAERVVVEQDIAAASNEGARARLFDDSVGIGYYPIDIHGHQDVPGAGQPSRPFQIPLGALVQNQVRNLIPSCKNIGTTHVTNGAYRLHPIEWAIGEAAGTLAAFCVRHHTTAEQVWRNQQKLRALQKQLLTEGAPLFWYDDVPTTHPHFEAIQFLSLCGVLSAPKDSLSFYPDQPMSQSEADEILRLLAYKKGSPAFATSGHLGKSHALAREEGGTPPVAATTTRAQFAQDVYERLMNKRRLFGRFAER